MIAFAISGGGNRGALAAGALLGLLEAGIHPDILVGTSAGALNAAGLAVEPTLAGAGRLATMWGNVRTADFFPGGWLSMFGRLLAGRSLFSSDALRKFVERQVLADKRCFGDLQNVRLYITAANLQTRTLYLYGENPEAPILDAVMASLAHPLVFPPVRQGEWQLVDGGVVANVPVGVALDKGATEIYILDVSANDDRKENWGSMLGVLDRSISMMLYQHFLMDLKHAVEQSNVALHYIPMRKFPGLRMWELGLGEQMVEAGRKAAQNYLCNPTGLHGMPLEVCEEAREEPPPPSGAEIYVPPWLSPSDLLDLPLRERQIVTCLIRRGPADARALAQALGWRAEEVREPLSNLVGKGRVCLSAEGQARVTFGWRRHRGLPDQVWTSLSPRETDCPGGTEAGPAVGGRADPR